MRYLVTVHCCGPNWLVRVPAFGVSTMVTEKRAIDAAARAMIAGFGTAPRKFDIDLDLGRVIDPVGDLPV